MRILNVGSGPAGIPILSCYDGHEVVRLDIDPQNGPDMVLDARAVGTLDAGSFDGVYCSHIIEHFYTHEVEQIVVGLHHILSSDGVCDVIVPDIGALLSNGTLTLDRMVYESAAGPITVHDMLYGYSGYHRIMAHPEYQSHRSGWSAQRLGGLMKHSGFDVVYSAGEGWDLRVLGFKQRPDAARLESLGVVL